MTGLSLHFERSLAASTAGNRGLRSKSRLFSPTELWALLIALAIILCLSVSASKYQSSNEQAVLAAMLGAGGMSLVYVPSALCRAPQQPLRFDQSEINALLRN